jgi:feruloyl esterase
LEFGFALADGVTSYPGWNYGGEDQAGGMVQWVTGSKAAQHPAGLLDGYGIQWLFGNGYVRYFIAQNPRFDPFRFSPADFASRIRQVSEAMDSMNPDLSQFLARGGKLILKENAADFAQSPFQGIAYYKSVVATMGQARADQFIRFYVTPGASHGGSGVDGSGAPLPEGVDLLGALDEWVEASKAPDTLVQVAQQAPPPFTVLSSRPLCRYPLYPRYNGRDDNKQASSFTCTPQ